MFAVKSSSTYCSLVPDGRLIVTVLPVAGFHVYVAEFTSVVHELSFVLPRTESVWVLVCQALDGGRSITRSERESDAPRLAVSVAGQVPSLLSQYVLVLPSSAFDAGYPEVVLLALIGAFSARLVAVPPPPLLVPVPERATVSEALVALLATVSVPDALPVAVGV